jgi:hypothetical protein
MFTIFDNLNAVVIGGVVIVVLLAMQLQVAEVNIEQTSNYMVKRQGVDLATWLEDDLLSLGANIDKSLEVPFLNPADSAGMTTEFVFYQDSINTTVSPADTMRITTRYQLEKAGTTSLEGDPVNVYRIQRDQRLDSGAWFSTGNSPAILSNFRIDMLDRDAKPVADPYAAASIDPDAIRNTRVQFTLITPFEVRQATLSRIYYGSTLMIPN